MVSKFFVVIPSLQLSEGSSKIEHWWVYDPDSKGQLFDQTIDFINHPNVKWNFMTPFKVSTHRLKATFSFDIGESATTGMRKVDNPWRNISEWSNPPFEHQNYSAIQHLFVSREQENVPAFKIMEQIVFTYLVSCNRNGQQYAV